MADQPRTNRLPVGQLLVNLTRIFRADLAAAGAGADGVDGIRPAHLQVFGVIKAEGSRLTDLAGWSGLSLAAMSELVDDLERMEYVKRVPDPDDRRAKLVRLTDAGWTAMRVGRRAIEEIEVEWAEALGGEEYERMTSAMQKLLDGLDPAIRAGYKEPPPAE